MTWFAAPPSSQRWAFALTALLAASVAPVCAQTAPKRVANVEDKTAPTVVEAEQIGGRPEREMNLQGNVELVRDKTRILADTACFKQVEDEVDASGHIRLTRFGDQYNGDLLKINLETGQGYLLNPTYRMALNHGQGKAERINFIDPENALVVDGTYSTCEGPNPDWYLKSSTLNLDTGRDVGTGSKTIVYFKDVPIIGTPAISFSLSGARRSGWLPPTPGYTSTGGPELLVPYYINIAPNRDLTLMPKLIMRRGLQMGADGRYIGETGAGRSAGQTYAEFLPHDEQTKTDRWTVNSIHTQALAAGLTAGWNIRAASDDAYPTDFSKTVAASAERQLLRELSSDYRSDYWSLKARVQNYQVLQDPAAVLDPSLTVARPYDRLPDVIFHTGRYDVGGGFDWSVDSEVTRFWHPELVRGNRLVVASQLSYPFVRPAYFITPKLILNASAYQLDGDAMSAVQQLTPSMTRTLPTVSVDSGLVFERSASLFGRSVTQTLEPRLFYVYTPYRDQSQIPLFDTAMATFNMSQLFSENRFIGADRIGDANQATAALVSRYIEGNGAERLRLTFGERFYFSNQRVQLDASSPLASTRSDILLAATGRIADTWGADSALQYSPSNHQVVSSNYSVQWQPAPKKVMNLAYRYLRATFQNIDASAQWPVSDHWYGVGHVSYSLLDKRTLESLIGLEYRRDCWIFRMGGQRFVTTTVNTSSHIFFQLELSGLSQLGVGNGLDTLTKSIPGYQRLNPVGL